MSSPLRLLQLTPRVSYPPLDGGRVVMLQSARSLQALGVDVHVLSLNPAKQRSDLAAAREALAPSVLDAIDIDTSRLFAPLAGLRIRAPFFVARFYSTQFEQALRALLQRERFDVVQVESPFLLPYVPAIREVSDATVVLRSLNVEFRIWEQLALHEKNLLKRMTLRAIAHSLRRYEIAQLDTCDAIVPITDADASELRALGCTRPMHVVPGGVDLDRYEIDRAAEREGAVYFLGSLDYLPNQEAALWIADELRPRIVAGTPGAQLHIGGSRAPVWLRERIVAAGVALSSDIADPIAFARPMSVMVAPLLSGGGMRLKIIEAMALGKPVVSTTLGASGIGARDGAEIVLADDVASFAAAVQWLLRDRARARAIGDAGRRLVEERYGNALLARDLLRFYEELTQRRRVDGRH